MEYQSLHMKTVVDLRKLARELKVKLPAGISKAEIISRLLEAQETVAPAEEPKLASTQTADAPEPTKQSDRAKKPRGAAGADEQPEAVVSAGTKAAEVVETKGKTISPAGKRPKKTGSAAEESAAEVRPTGGFTPADVENIAEESPLPEVPAGEMAKACVAEKSAAETTKQQTAPEEFAAETVKAGREGAVPEETKAVGNTERRAHSAFMRGAVQRSETGGGYQNRVGALRGPNGQTAVARTGMQQAAGRAQRYAQMRPNADTAVRQGYDATQRQPGDGQPRQGGYARSGESLTRGRSEYAQPRRNYDDGLRRGADEPPRRIQEEPTTAFRPEAESSGDVSGMRPEMAETGLRDGVTDAAAQPESINLMECDEGAGMLEIQPEGHGFLRAENCLPGSRDVYISIAQIRRFNLRMGDWVVGKIRPRREGDRYSAMMYITEINGEPPEHALNRRPFESLVPVYPDERLRMESADKSELTLRLIDMLAPIGKGQRGMIVSQPKAGKTTMLKQIANAISENNPEAKLLVLLIDERPEEVTDMKRSIKGEVIYSTFDEEPENHTRVSEMVLEHAQRRVEMGQDVVILLDSITRLARAYNLVIQPTGRSLSGGMDPGALNKPKRFFGAARNIENGGSLTIIATALVDTGSRMDDVIFEEFKGTGNMELHLDRRLSDKRIFPAIDLLRSGTRREELLLSPAEQEGVYQVRRMLSGNNVQENTEQLIALMEKTANNGEFYRKLKGWINVYAKDGYSMGGR